jgi:hypothetical protein
MPNSEKIELLISPEALKQFEQLKSASDANTASLEKLIAKAVELNKAVGNATSFKEINKATAEMADNEKALSKQVDELTKANDKLQKLYSDEAKKITEIKVQQQEQNKVLKEQAKEALGLVGAYDKLTKEYNEAAKEAKNLAAQFGAQSKQAKEASARALELDARLKAADANVGRFNKNVGNYSGALKVMEKGLADVKKKIDDYTNSGNQNADMLAALQKEESLLEQLLQAQVSGFASGTQEVRANTKALEALAGANLQGTETFQKLFAATANLKDEVSDLKTALKNAAPDDVAFNAATDAAKGLVGVYGFAQSAAAVFGEKNEALQETFIKLQAAETALQSIEAIRAVFKKENAVRQAVEIVQGKIVIAQKYLETAAESKNIIVKYTAIAAQKALNFATSAAGGPLLLLIGLLATAFVSMAAYGDGAEDAAKKNERLNKSLERTNKAIDESDKIIKAKGDKAIANLEDNFATEQNLRDQREQNLQDEIDNLKKFNELDKKNREDAIREVARLTSGKNKQDKEAIDKAIQVRDGYLANLQKVTDKENELEIVRLQNSRTTKEEFIKSKQDEIEAQKTQLQTNLQLQQSIAGNERETQDARIDALREAEKIQEQIIRKDTNSKLLNPTLTPSEIKAIEAQRTAALTQARRESNKAIEDLNRSYAERERKARFDIIKTEIEDQIKADDLIIQNEKNGFDKRLDALYDALQKRRDILVAQHDLDIQNDTLTADERIAIEKKYISDINGLTVEYGLQQQQLYQQNQEKVNEIIEKGQQARQNKIAGDSASATTELIKSLIGGQTSLEDFNRQREKSERDARIQSLKEEVNNATAKVLVTKEGTAERYEAERILREKTLALNEEYHAKEIEAITKLNDLKKQLAVDSVETFNSLINSQFDNEAKRVQQSLDDLDKQKDKDIEVANATIANKQERELAIATIEKKAQVQREQLERRQRQIELDRARFEKASNIAQIISTTAIAVIKAFKDYAGPQAFPIAAAIGAIGALQLAKAIAAPLPAFEHGTLDAPGGPALVSEKRRELVITPQGQIMQTPSVPTVMNIPRHSIVLPDARAALESGLAVNRHGRLVQQDNQGIQEVGRKIDTLTKVMRNKPVLNMNANERGLTAMWNYGANWVTYVEDQTSF